MPTLVATFSSSDDAEQAVNALKEAGFSDEEISVVARDDGGQDGDDDGFGMGQNLTGGTATGGALGGLAGLLAGAGALAIPGIGPIIAAGPIAAGLSGAVMGGLAGGLIDLGIPEERGQYYEDRVREGDILVAVKADDDQADQADRILNDYGADEVESH
ncbi:MAG: hypothetical protein GX058_07070 [Firmicutes bacterium]|nr:hypothetical protein [Bacillota bacterium]